VDIIQLEKLRQELEKNLTQAHSLGKRFFLISDFFDSLFEFENKNLIQSYLLEYMDLYLTSASQYDFHFIPPVQLRKSIELSEKIYESKLLPNYNNSFLQIIEKISLQLDLLQKKLNGEDEFQQTNEIFFPALEESEQSGERFGMLESINITITASSVKEIFIVDPAENEIEQKLNEQIKISFQLAKDYLLKQKKRINPHHKVIIQFENRFGYYLSNSLGVVLTIKMIEELLQFYNTPFAVKIPQVVAATGGMNNKGEILSVSKDLIKQKTRVVFFSSADILIVPKDDEASALEELIELNKEFPKRALRIIGLPDLNDLLDRRTLVEIQKQSVPKRAINTARKHWINTLSIILLTIFFSLLITQDWDNKPTIVKLVENRISVQNKNEKELFSKSATETILYQFEQKARLIDINKDGVNELILTAENKYNLRNTYPKDTVRCYNNFGKLIWEFAYEDTVPSLEEKFEKRYIIGMIDTVTVNDIKLLYLIVNNAPYYPSSIFALDLKTGKKVGPTLWHPGRIRGGIIKFLKKDFPNLVLAGVNNGLNNTIIFSISVNNMNGQAPTSEPYYFLNLPLAKFDQYIVLPKSDYTEFFKTRFNYPPDMGIIDNEAINNFETCTLGGKNNDPKNLSIRYSFDYNFNSVKTVITDDFQMKRDDLVQKKILPPPYIDTPDYIEMLERQLLRWDGEKFVKFKNKK